jgi:hypothetical protein
VALATSQFTAIKRRPMGPGMWMVTGTFTGPASYTSAGEDFTNAKVKGALGINRIYALHFSDLIDENGSAIAAAINFDHNRTSTSQGKIRISAATRSHTHDLKIIGGQAAAGTGAVSCPAATDLFGKEEATNADVLGADVLTKGGVMLSAQQNFATEADAGSDASGYVCTFVCYGC